jgi:hypothetical protein
LHASGPGTSDFTQPSGQITWKQRQLSKGRLFDAGLHPTLLKWLTIGSSLDRSGELGARLWVHYFGSVLSSSDQVGLGESPAA